MRTNGSSSRCSGSRRQISRPGSAAGRPAIADYESLLADLPGDDWLNRDTRRRLEEIFLRDDDLSGLVTYYEGQLAKRPDDLDALCSVWPTISSRWVASPRPADGSKRVRCEPPETSSCAWR